MTYNSDELVQYLSLANLTQLRYEIDADALGAKRIEELFERCRRFGAGLDGKMRAELIGVFRKLKAAMYRQEAKREENAKGGAAK